MKLIYFLLVIFLGGCSSIERAEVRSSPPPANRFTRQILVDGLDEPMQIEFDRQGRIYWIERGGEIRRLDESGGKTILIGSLPVSTRPGLIGFLLGRDFETTRQLYVYYSAAEDKGEVVRLSRFTLNADGKLGSDSEIIMLQVPWQQPSGFHMGGGMVWDEEGNLYLSVGGDTRPGKYSSLAFTNQGGRGQDAARTAGNTNDLRGAILRIHPQPDGTYTIPEGNLFTPGTPKTRPEIYTMGNRNPWRLSIDSETGYLHWGEVGPDAGRDSAGVGPKGYDEFNVARKAGNFGWPFFIGYNHPYNRYNYKTGTYGAPFDPDHPVNSSPNNTGLRELPPAQPALIEYPYGVSREYPILNSGGRCAIGGPVFRQADFGPDASRVFPSYYEGKWFVVDYVRSWIMVITMNEKRTEVLSVERFLPEELYTQPIDMDFGPEGDLYVVEYNQSPEGRISKITYNAGNRAPIVQSGADRNAGSIPFKVQLSSKGTVDYDKDNLSFEWMIKSGTGEILHRYTEANPVVTFEQPGRYQAVLRVSDPSGATGSDKVQLTAGNEPPRVELEITRGNRSFYFPNETIEYAVRVSDYEDGNLTDGGISAHEVNVTVEYVPSGIRPAELAKVQDKLNPDASLRYIQAEMLMDQSDCSSCHGIADPLIGPSFTAIADRYKNREGAVDSLAQKVLAGSSGDWGDMRMPPHPDLTATETRKIVQYILSLAKPDVKPKRVPVQGNYTTQIHELPGRRGKPQHGSYVLRATYTDRGANSVASLTGSDMVVLRYPSLAPETANVMSESVTFTSSTNDPNFIVSGQRAYIGFKQIDLTGISRIEIGALTRFYNWTHFIGATIEVRMDSPEGPLVGSPCMRIPPALTSPGETFLGDKLEPPVQINATDVNGIHDVYVVVRNEDAGKNDALLILTEIVFKQ